MEHYRCEEASICTNFHEAICLHCDHRLCLLHLTEHNKSTSSNVITLVNEVEETRRHLDKESEKRQQIYDNILTSCDRWRIQQIDKIQQIYDKQLKLIQSQQQTLNHTQEKLFEKLERDVQKPLEYLQTQRNVSAEIQNHIQQTMKQIREDNAYLKWNLTTPSLPVDMDDSPLPNPTLQIPLSGIIYNKYFFSYN